ncbi:hypothetical protein, partial [Listeria monocytogenes]|uniref:hypothetical protein n=1 Tax=Listeria monocytogenes TaxID=1639 RepID=UPI001A7EA103
YTTRKDGEADNTLALIERVERILNNELKNNFGIKKTFFFKAETGFEVVKGCLGGGECKNCNKAIKSKQPYAL